MHYVSMTFAPVVEITEAVETAIARARQLNMPVRFEFNSRDIEVTGASVPSDVINEYMRRKSGGRDDGGPAFPCAVYQTSDCEAFRHYHDGVSLWDYYAAAALTGELASQYGDGGAWPDTHVGVLAARIGVIADAMIAERKKRGIGK